MLGKEFLYFMVGAVLATVINLALGVDFPLSIATGIPIIVVVVSTLVYLDKRRDRPSSL